MIKGFQDYFSACQPLRNRREQATDAKVKWDKHIKAATNCQDAPIAAEDCAITVLSHSHNKHQSQKKGLKWEPTHAQILVSDDYITSLKLRESYYI